MVGWSAVVLEQGRATARPSEDPSLRLTSIIMLPFPPLKIDPPNVNVSWAMTQVTKNMLTPSPPKSAKIGYDAGKVMRP